MAEEVKLQYGLCDITVDGTKVITLLGDAAEFTAEPQYEDIDLYEVPAYDKLLTGWDVRLKIVLEDYQYSNLEIGMPMLEHNIGFSDGALMQRARDKATELIIHPREKLEADKASDLTIFKAFPISAFQIQFGKELSKWEVEFVGLAKTADPKQIGNYFRIGEAPVAI
jgi:hypothetical protein